MMSAKSSFCATGRQASLAAEPRALKAHPENTVQLKALETCWGAFGAEAPLCILASSRSDGLRRHSDDITTPRTGNVQLCGCAVRGGCERC